MNQKRWSPYLFGGIAVYHYNPYTFDQRGNKIFLQPLGTEGQGLPGYDRGLYNLTQLAIPFGGGIKYAISDKVQLGLEVGLRKLFTDYLDDVSGNYADEKDLLNGRGQEAVDISYRGDERINGTATYPTKGTQRGSPKYKDYYYFTGLHLSFRLGDGGEGSRRMGGKKDMAALPTRCKHFIKLGVTIFVPTWHTKISNSSSRPWKEPVNWFESKNT
jgi:hypothetical protein